MDRQRRQRRCGRRHRQTLTIQSISKPFAYDLAVRRLSVEAFIAISLDPPYSCCGRSRPNWAGLLAAPVTVQSDGAPLIRCFATGSEHHTAAPPWPTLGS
ncbi:hypothetical protein SYNGFB01_00030 [Synechococcus sp. GFB01]|nr:hypothetical protein SYNGFB01_00030 [Synechococcus sp. GFB01]